MAQFQTRIERVECGIDIVTLIIECRQIPAGNQVGIAGAMVVLDGLLRPGADLIHGGTRRRG